MNGEILKKFANRLLSKSNFANFLSCDNYEAPLMNIFRMLESNELL